MEARLPMDKIEQIKSVLISFLDKKSCTKQQLLSLLGHLNFSSRVIYPGRAFVSYLITLSTTVKAWRPRWLSWMRRPTGYQEVAGSTPAKVGNILSWRLIMKYFLRSFSPFR